MILTSVTIDAFRTLISPQRIDIDPKITVLIGANESGKTNLLEAIQASSISNKFQPEDISKCRSRKYAKKEMPIITFSFSLNKEDRNHISKEFLLPDTDKLIIQRNGNEIKNFALIIPKNDFINDCMKQKK